MMQTVKVEGGYVSGVTDGTGKVSIFKGIPYAAPPVGDLRWKAPQSVIPWSGIRKADSYGNACIQNEMLMDPYYKREFHTDPNPMSEDCLYLNIWTPAVSDDAKTPVMMWIHGGSFRQGYGHEIEFDGEKLAEHGVIVVTINYRLGILGFLAHPELSRETKDGISGNYGLLDQITALRWIKNNIVGFGGDPANVTIFGQSSGAMCVQALSTSPLTKELFTKAIMQSGGGIHMIEYVKLQNAEKQGSEFAGKINKSTLKELREVPAQELIMAASGFSKDRIAFRPNIDGVILPEDVSDAIYHGHQHNIPYLIGSTADEMRMVFKNMPEDMFRNNMKNFYGKFADKFINLFCTDHKLTGFDNFMAVHMAGVARAWAQVQADQGNRAPMYVYSFIRALPGDGAGAYHNCELWYVFETLRECWRPFENTDYEISLAMSQYWTNFAKFGNPNGAELPEWTAYTNTIPHAMSFGDKIEMIEKSDDPKVAFVRDYLTGRLR
ncbi:carboxylesterase/lipase family protein [Caproicibacter sp.]|uniref:carboxylesterase/lipase family protein n=1 Tax=Caproicibacter sp. TaxID=2814884 RepID=UPI00398A2386